MASDDDSGKAKDLNSNADSDAGSADHENCSNSQRGPTVKSKATKKGKIVVKYNKRGVPTGDGAKKLATFEGIVARSMVPITFDSWLEVDNETKEACWQYVLSHFILDPKSRKHSLQSIGSKWKNFKYYLFMKFIKGRKDLPSDELNTPPAMYPHLKKDWKQFVSKRTSKKWEEKSKKAKDVRACNQYDHRLSRKGYSGLISEIMDETGKDEEEIDRVECWKRARQSKKGDFNPKVQKVVDKILELQKDENFEEDPCGKEDLLTHALGTTEQRGRVRGMGKFVTPNQYFYLPKTVKHYMDKQTKKMSRRLNRVEDKVERLEKHSHYNNASEAASCQVGLDEDFEDEELKEPEDPDHKSCYLAVDVPSNIVAKGTVMNKNLSDGIVEVNLEICLQGEALLPYPLEEDLVEKVKDGVGFILRWPNHLVIRCADLNKIVSKKTKKLEGRKDAVRKSPKKLEGMKDVVRKSPRKLEGMRKDADPKEPMMTRKSPRKRMEKEETGKKREREPGEDDEIDQVVAITDDAINVNKKKKNKAGKEKEPLPRKSPRKMTRAQRKTRLRVENSTTLRMVEMMVDSQVAKVNSIRVQCEDSLYGHVSFTYLTFDDVDRVFAMDEISGAVITSYTMYLFEQIKNGPKIDHGVCFMSPTTVMNSDNVRLKARNVDDSSRAIAQRLSTKKGSDIVLDSLQFRV